jgi:2-(1,2-epoxy-1,2-dihydrophenyl)acetyl-CoA isomerase
MSEPAVLLTVEDGLATLLMNRPDRLNALTPAMGHQMAAALDDALAQGARALLITGAGRAFCSGADIAADSPVVASDDWGEPLEQSYNALVLRLTDYPLPVVVALNGPAVGAGCALALLGDIVVAARSAYLMLPFAQLGLVPDCGSTWLVMQAVGRQRGLELMLLGEKIGAEKALDWGLINRVADEAGLMAEATALARQLADGPTKSLGMIRRAAPAALTGSLADMLAIERNNQREAGHTEDAREAMAAFAQKRKPVYNGR